MAGDLSSLAGKEEKTFELKLEAGKSYKICTCGNSRIMPLCDNSHRNLSNYKDNPSLRSLKICSNVEVILTLECENYKCNLIQ